MGSERGAPAGEWVVNMKTISKIELKTRSWPPPGQDRMTCTGVMVKHKTTPEILGMEEGMTEGGRHCAMPGYRRNRYSGNRVESRGALLHFVPREGQLQIMLHICQPLMLRVL